MKLSVFMKKKIQREGGFLTCLSVLYRIIMLVHWDLNHFIMKAMCLFTGFGISSKMWDYPFGTLIKDWHWCADPASTLPCLWAPLSFRNRLMTCSFLSLLYNHCRGIYINRCPHIPEHMYFQKIFFALDVPH